MYVRQLFLSWEGGGFPVIWKPFNFLPAFLPKCWKKSWILKFCCFWTRFVTQTYPILALSEILLFLDTFCNTIVSDYRTGEFGLSAWTLSLLSYLEKSIYQNSMVKTRALSRASVAGHMYIPGRGREKHITDSNRQNCE